MSPFGVRSQKESKLDFKANICMMSNTRYAKIRPFLTEWLTVAAVEVFEEVGNIEGYNEENKRLRSIIPVTPDPVTPDPVTP